MRQHQAQRLLVIALSGTRFGSLQSHPKCAFFAWKLAKDILPTKRNKFLRRIEPDATCSLCGCAAEDSFHATVDCPRARSLRFAMREHWPIPSEELIRRSGPDWFLLLLERCSTEQGELTTLMLWRLGEHGQFTTMRHVTPDLQTFWTQCSSF